MLVSDKLTFALQIIVALTAMSATAAWAAPTFDQQHPRRALILERLSNQEQRIEDKVAKGQLNARQARQLRQATARNRARHRLS